MRRFSSLVFGLLAIVVFAVSCRDNGPTSPREVDPRKPIVRQLTMPSGCPSRGELVGLYFVVFQGPAFGLAIAKLDDLDIHFGQSRQDRARAFVAFIQQLAAAGDLSGTPAQVQALINAILCYAGITPDTFLVEPNDPPQVLLANGGNTGVSLPANAVSVPTTITITQLDAPPLDTKLDQYPGFITLTQSLGTLIQPVVVGVCATGSIASGVLARLRLGHQASTGFEITPDADAGFLTCSTVTGQSRMPGWLKKLASVVTPKALYAKQGEESFRGVGGTVTEFSPFAPVDPELELKGGVGGTVTEFQRTPSRADSFAISAPSTADAPTRPASPRDPSQLAPQMSRGSRSPGARANTVVAGECTAIDAIVGNAVEAECRPGVVLTTHLGTILQNVPVGWAIGSGGGVVAPQALATQSCGTFGATAATTTNVNGKAGVCWTLGSTPGANTVVATPTAGGDVPPGVTFSPATITFTATANQITPTVSATGGSFPYDGLPHAGSGTCSNGLTPALTYSGGGSVPTNAGNYTLTVTCGAGDPLYVTVTATAAIDITGAATATVVTCPASEVFTGSALTPCTATVTGPGGLSAPVIPTYTDNVNVGTATANANYPGGGNYQSSSGSATFAITAAPTTTVVTCPVSSVFTGSALTPCTATVTGPGLSQAVSPTYANNTNVGTATANASYPAGGNYQGSTGSASFLITPAGTSTVVSCPLSVVYTSMAHTPCTATTTGPGLGVSTPIVYGNNTNVGTATANAAFVAGGNYQGSSGSASFLITPAGTSTVVSCPASVVHTGSAQTPCTATTTGPGLSGAAPIVYSNNVNVGTATANAAFATGGNYLGSTGSANFQITPAAPPGPGAMLWIGLASSGAVGLRIDLRTEVLVGGNVVASSEVNNLTTGSSGFNNAILRTVALPGVNVPSGSQLGLRVSVRRTCFGAGHNSGTVRLWFNGQPIDAGNSRDAGSRFGTASATHYLRTANALSQSAGSAKTSVDALVNITAACPSRPFVPFGTWSETMP